jgi:predicted nucleic acid-binding protein
VSPALLLDNSAWARFANPKVPQERAEEIAWWLESRQLATCLPFVLEAGYSARSGQEHAALVYDLLALPLLHIDERVEQRAIEAQGQLARTGQHRLAPADLLIAATADVHGVGVFHYDHDFDILREKTDLRFDSVWLAPRGTL